MTLCKRRWLHAQAAWPSTEAKVSVTAMAGVAEEPALRTGDALSGSSSGPGTLRGTLRVPRTSGWRTGQSLLLAAELSQWNVT